VTSRIGRREPRPDNDRATRLREHRQGGLVRVLAVDDEAMIRELVGATLSVEPTLEVRVAGDGDEALRVFAEFDPDLVLLDVRMPGRDGLDVCRSIRESHPYSSCTILFLSAMGQDSDLAAGTAAGADGYMTKPFSPGDLLARVRAIGEAQAIDPGVPPSARS
jgi:DNA-binding response OmpR family regulator